MSGSPISYPDNPHLPALLIEPSSRRVSLQLDRLWAYRELLYFLIWRDVKVRYKQTALGVLWILLQPIASMVIFTLLFGHLLAVPSGDAPYPLFAFAALLPWNYFAGSLHRAGASLVGNTNLITRVYFPRLIIPVSSVLSGLVDFAIAFVLLLGLMFYFGVAPTAAVWWLPAFLLLALITALGFGLWLAALNVRYRDVNHMMPFLVQLWMYATPVVYGSSLIPERFRLLLALNPMTGVVEGFRWALLGSVLGDARPPAALFFVSVIMALLVLIAGLIYFRRTERAFADII